MRFSARALLFDNDGVLVDSHEQVVQGWTRLCREFDLDIDVVLTTLVGVRAVDTLQKYLPANRVGEATARIEQIEVELATQTAALRGAVELLDALGDAPWTIVTSAGRRLATARWHGAGIPVPKVTVTAADVSHGKPHPAPFLAGAKLLSVDPSDCIAFEDSPAGGEAARAAGMTVIAVGAQPWTFEPAARIRDLSVVQPVVTDTSIEFVLS